MDKYNIKKILPNQKILDFGIDNNLIDSPGLMMHIFLSRILIIALSEKIPENLDFNLDIALDLASIYHSSRQEADYGKIGKSKNKETNSFMKTNGDIDFALKEAGKYIFDEQILNGIKNFIITPKNRKAYFPHETLEIKGEINFTESIAMLSSWLIAGVITNIDIRFNDLKERRSGEIGKVEMDYIKDNLDKGKYNENIISDPILEIAILDKRFNIKNKNDLIQNIKDGKINNEILGEWILDGYKIFANKIINNYCKVTGIDNFYKYIKESLDKISDLGYKEKIKSEFEKFLGRKLLEYEIVPYIPGVELTFKILAGLKIEETKVLYREKLIRILKNSERVSRLLNNNFKL